MQNSRTTRARLWCTLLILTTLPGMAADRPVQVTTASLAEIAVHQHYSAPATTLSLNDSRISAETSGTLLKIPVQVGDRVQQGELLTSLDCRDNQLKLQRAEAALASAQARLTLAQRQLTRTRSLHKSNSISEERLNQQEAELRIAQADQQAQQTAIAEARLNRQRCEIRAPFAGVVRERLAGEGEWVNPGQPLIHLIDLQRLEISAQVSVDLVSSLEKATSIVLESNQGVFPVKLRRVVPVVESLGRNREVRLQFVAERAMPGSSGRLLWQSQQTYVPADLPVRRGDTLGLFILEQGKARFIPLPGALEGHPTPVDLPADTRLVIEGRQALSDGSAIKLTD